MLDFLVTTQPTAHERDRAIRVVRQHALDDQDQAELLDMLGLAQDDVPMPAPRPHGNLSAAELLELFAPFAAERAALAAR
ncbi:hypothetical protein [Amycolatopsis sp. MtRt-6]|uniref:hypothetical protein n=1 Tax=Amycolatopsis sp. MtRt-6 TaxID=2792782 RepID=UPI001A8FC7F5|nr:hypothetical protein [Amycolatopsis sp. MtRt-6]